MVASTHSTACTESLYFGHPMEVLGTVVVIAHLTSLGKESLDVFPYPLGPVTDDAEAHLRFRN
jgi:hypothetical protein